MRINGMHKNVQHWIEGVVPFFCLMYSWINAQWMFVVTLEVFWWRHDVYTNLQIFVSTQYHNCWLRTQIFVANIRKMDDTTKSMDLKSNLLKSKVIELCQGKWSEQLQLIYNLWKIEQYTIFFYLGRMFTAMKKSEDMQKLIKKVVGVGIGVRVGVEMIGWIQQWVSMKKVWKNTICTCRQVMNFRFQNTRQNWV